MSEAYEFVPLRLKPREERRLRGGHPWVYSNEIDVQQTPLQALEPGQPVRVETARGQVIGTGYANPRSLICARLLSRDPRHPFSISLLVHRLKVALSLRERLYPSPWYRLVHGEGDGLPGLVVDRYGELLVVQISTAGMERIRDDLLQALQRVLRPVAVLLRNDLPLRRLEGLEPETGTVLGEVPDMVWLQEGEARFGVDLVGGQKTGWFFDQRDNRLRLQRYVRGARVLDLFSYVGGWGIQAALAGAEGVTCVDASDTALNRLADNARANNVGDRVEGVRGDAAAVLRDLRERRQRYDVVVVDPPAFIKSRKQQRVGLEGYHNINRLAMQVLERDGFLISCSCSHHLQNEQLLGLLRAESRHLGRELQLLEIGTQGPDHPVHPALPETGYLKALFTRTVKL
jgi:23S rRNA (cytosine1962-C5)-methyltransferase